MGHLTPTMLSRTYQVKLTYRLRQSPRIWVVHPQLQERPDEEPIPHLYPDGSLCLYRPHKEEWTAIDFIAETIIPWAALWLYHYEIWHSIGEWLGGGEHPQLRRPYRVPK